MNLMQPARDQRAVFGEEVNGVQHSAIVADMDLEALKSYWDAFYEDQVKTLLATKTIVPSFVVVSADGTHNLILMDPAMLDDWRSKDQLADEIRKVIALNNGVAVMSVLDTFFGSPTSREAGEFMHKHQMSVEKGESLGLCTKRECLLGRVESPIMQSSQLQFYRRDKYGNVTLEERQVKGDEYAVGGRFTFFHDDEPPVGRSKS